MKSKLLFLLTPFVLLLSGCGTSQPVKKEGSTKTIVAVSIPPYISLVNAIGGKAVQAISAIADNQNPHLTETTFSQVKLIDNAALWIGIGESYEPKILSVLKRTNPHLHILAMNTHFPLMTITSDTIIPPQASTHEGGHSHEHHHGHSHSHDGSMMDPHFFLSPSFLQKEAELIKDALVQVDPKNQTLFEKNFQVLSKQIDRLNKKLHSQLGRVSGKGILVSHSALGYFCADFNLKQYALESHGKPLLPQTIDEVLKKIATEHILCGFSFIDHSNKALLQVANAIDVHTYEINPMAEDLMGTLNQIGDDLENSL